MIMNNQGKETKEIETQTSLKHFLTWTSIWTTKFNTPNLTKQNKVTISVIFVNSSILKL